MQEIILVQEKISLGGFHIHSGKNEKIIPMDKNGKISPEESCDPAQVSGIIIKADFKLTLDWMSRFPHLEKIGLVSTGKDNIPFPLPDSIRFIHGEGFNARAVAEYTYEALLELYRVAPEMMGEKIGIIGYGRIGKILGSLLVRAGLRFDFYDPLTHPEKKEFYDAGIVSFHVPLTVSGNFPTMGMVKKDYFIFRDSNPYIIQTSRGKIWDPDFYLSYAQTGKIWCQDVYPVEPPDVSWIPFAEISTPHIAGYSMAGKTGGTEYVLRQFFGNVERDEDSRGSYNPLPEISTSYRSRKNFTEFRDNFPPRKEWKDFSPAEKESFLSRYQKLPIHLTSVLWENESLV